jgi:hypothetical protein
MLFGSTTILFAPAVKLVECQLVSMTVPLCRRSTG